MLDSIFIAILIVAVIFQLFAIYEKSIIFSIFTTMFWLVLMANALYIETNPYFDQVFNATSGNVENVTGIHYFHDPALGILFLGFVFINIVWAVVQIMNFQEKGGGLIP